MRQPKYAIGDTVYLARAIFETQEKPCPDCLGRRTWQAILPTGEGVIFGCPTCDVAYGSRGTVSVSCVTGSVTALTIGSVRVDSAEKPERQVSYMALETGIGSGSIYYEAGLCPGKDLAESTLPELIREREQSLQESRAMNHSRSRERTGRMAAHYRAQIRAAKKEIEQAKLGLAREAK